MWARCVISAELTLIFACGSVIGAPVVSGELPIVDPVDVAYSPSGEQIAVGGLTSERDGLADGVVLLIDADNGDQHFALRHSGRLTDNLQMPNPIHCLAYSRNGQLLAVASDLGLKLWNPADGKELATLLGYGIDDKNRQVKVSSIAFSPDDKLLAAVDRHFSERNRLSLWDVAKREVVGAFELGYESSHVEFLPDGTLLVSADNDDSVSSYRLANGRDLAVVRVQPGRFAVDRQGQHVAAGGRGETMWRVKPTDRGSWKLVDRVQLAGQGPLYGVSYVAFSPDGQLLATYGRAGAMVIYDTQKRHAVGTLLAGGPFAFSPDGTAIAVAGQTDRHSPDGGQPGGTRVTIWKTTDVLDADRLAEQARTAATDLVHTLSAPQPESWKFFASGAMMDMLRERAASRPDVWMGQDATVTVLAGPWGDAATSILIDGLQSPQVKDKQRLLHPLGLLARRDAKARTAIVDALRSAKAVDVRSMAASMLALPSPDVGKQAVPALVDAAVSDESPQVRSAAERTLKELDAKAYEQARAQVRARGPVADQVERRGGRLFYQGRSLHEWLGRLSASYMPNEIFGQPLPDEPLAAIRAMGPDAVPLIVATLKSEEQPLRRAAAAELGSHRVASEVDDQAVAGRHRVGRRRRPELRQRRARRSSQRSGRRTGGPAQGPERIAGAVGGVDPLQKPGGTSERRACRGSDRGRASSRRSRLESSNDGCGWPDDAIRPLRVVLWRPAERSLVGTRPCR